MLWKHVDGEKLKDYKQLYNELIGLGYTIKSVTMDGKRGLYRLFEAYPIQMCHFHQIKIIQRYLTKNPKLEQSHELQKIVDRLTSTTQTRFTNKLDDWYNRHEEFLNERTVNEETGKSRFTHYRLVSAYKSLRRNLPYLFTYKNNSDIEMPNTTNTLDGGTFSHLKLLISVHRGLSKKLKIKMVDDYFLNYKKKV